MKSYSSHSNRNTVRRMWIKFLKTRGLRAFITLTILFAFFSVLPLSGQTALVEYIAGNADCRPSAGSWSELHIGDTLSGDTQLRLVGEAIVELSAGGRRITVHQPGTYRVDELIDLSATVENYGVRNLITSRLRRVVMADPSGSGQSAAMGVRGFADVPDLEVEWMDEESQYYIEESRILAEQGRYDEALEILFEGLEWAFEDEKPDYLLEIAELYAETGRIALATEHIQQINLNEHDPRYHAYFLLKTQLLIETLAFHQGLAEVDRYLAVHSGPAHTQAAMILAAFCHHGLGNLTQARNTLHEAAAIDPGSDLAQTALETASALDSL